MRNLLLKDLRRRWRSPAATLAMLIFPIFMTGMLGLVIRGGDGGAELPPLHLLVEDRDEGMLTQVLQGALGNEEAQKRLRVEFVGEEGRLRMERGEASALLIFPVGFTDSVLAGSQARLELVRNPAEGIAPEIIEQGTHALAAYLDQARRLLADQLLELKLLIEEENVPPATRVAALAGAVTERMQGVERYLFPPLLRIESVKEARPAGGSSLRGYLLIMTTVMALLFVAVRSVGDLFDERKSGMLRRQLASPAGIERIVGAKLIFGVLLGLLVLAILAAIGFLTRWLRPPIDAAGALLLAVAFCTAACGAMALVFALVRTEKQAGILGWLVVMAMSALGGSMVNLEAMPAPMRAAAPLTLNYWAIEGFKLLVFEGAGLGEVRRHVLVLAGTGGAALLAGYLIMVRRFRELQP